ncbi:hypothetical protein NP493_359g02025 [Ridgeia piscesae]|uniref:DNA replication complex GINS protein PSF1 n=1 Tax=Ridgeia piscesae TaxID=27915 RepID=A0AAD9L390_RIDPI|nr:hypothetical protein NP493_359g02025 [Ridgeia piscesae]
MFGEKALELVKELQRSKTGTISAINEDVMRQVLEEMRALFEQNQRDVTLALAGEQLLFSAIQIRHSALERNKRCLLAYLAGRLNYVRETRWQFGSVLPAEVKQNLSEPELQWFNKYSKCLANYMSSIGGHGGLDLTQDVKPPKTLYIEVRCLTDHGEFETQDGSIVLLKKNSQHFMLRSECEHLVRQGFLEHIVH